jgi:uncharacterized protein (TIGR04222 family)
VQPREEVEHDVDGPTFLLVYTLVAIAVITVAYGMVRGRDQTGLREPPLVPATFDPYEIAYLRGGKYAVIRTVIYALYQRGLVEILPRKWYQPNRLAAKDDGRSGTLTALEALVFRAVSSPVDPSTLFQSALLNDVERLCEPFRNSLQSERLVRSDADRGSALVIPFVASVILVSLSLYRFVAESMATPQHRSFGFLIVLTIASLIVLWGFLVGPAVMARISDRGRAYLRRIQAAYRDVNMPTVAMVGLFGIGILSKTSDAAFAKLFPKGGSGGGGFGVESSGCGSGGCGGGCGGCGGGGD